MKKHCIGVDYSEGTFTLQFSQAQLETLKMDFQEKKVNKNSFIEECEVVHDLKRVKISFEISRFLFFLKIMLFFFHNAAPLLAS